MDGGFLGDCLPFWDKLDSGQQKVLLDAAGERRYRKDEMLHNGSADCVGLLLVCKGQLRVYMLSDEGKELTLYRLFERDLCLFSASCMLQDIRFDVFVAAAEDTTVLQIPTDVYKRLMDNSAAVANFTNQLMASHFSDVMWLMDQILNKKLDSRLAALLLEERELAGADTLETTHEQLGNHLGSVREVITRMLRYFQSEGLVKLARGCIELVDIPRLQALAQYSLRANG